MKHTPGPWYKGSTGNHQSLICSELTGESIAVSYDKKNAQLIAEAPNMLAALEHIEKLYQNTDGIINKKNFRDLAVTIHVIAQRAISEAKEA